VETGLTGLLAETTYHYRVVATNAAGTSEGLDATFATGRNSAPLAPSLLGLSTSRTADIIVPLPENLDPDGESVTFSIDIQPAFGRADVINNTSIRFTPGAGFKGRDSFTYAVTDGNLARTVGTVTIRNPFTSLKGSYLTKIATAQGEPKGTVKLTIGANGAFSGTVNYGRVIAVRGTFSPTTGERSGTAAISIPRKGLTPLVIVLRIDTKDENGVLSGTVDNFDIAPDARLLRTKNTPLASLTDEPATPARAGLGDTRHLKIGDRRAPWKTRRRHSILQRPATPRHRLRPNRRAAICHPATQQTRQHLRTSHFPQQTRE
jgi:hypothetical protein